MGARCENKRQTCRRSPRTVAITCEAAPRLTSTSRTRKGSSRGVRPVPRSNSYDSENVCRPGCALARVYLRGELYRNAVNRNPLSIQLDTLMTSLPTCCFNSNCFCASATADSGNVLATRGAISSASIRLTKSLKTSSSRTVQPNKLRSFR